MKENKKKQFSTELRAKYTWYLSAPFARSFDRNRWWSKPPPQDNETFEAAACYELARRHPIIGELRKRFAPECFAEFQDPSSAASYEEYRFFRNQPHAIDCIYTAGLKSWPQLDEGVQKWWRNCGCRLKGVSLREEFESGYCVTTQAIEVVTKALRSKRHTSPVGSEDRARLRDRIAALEDVWPGEIQKAVATISAETHEKGFLLFAMSPDLKREKACEIFGKCYSAITAGSKRNALNPLDWLHRIEEFEDSQTNRRTLKSGVFTQYRRAIDDLALVVKP